MRTLLLSTFALAVGVMSTSVFADNASRVPLSPDAVAAHRAAVAADQGQRGKRVLLSAPKKDSVSDAAPKVAGSTTVLGTPRANGFRTYPPSCGAVPLPDKPSGPLVTQRMTFFADDGSVSGSTEDVTLTIWRVPCSSSGSLTPYNFDGGDNAITLMRIDRDAQYEGDTTFYPTMPNIAVSQGGSNFDGSPNAALRLGYEPNTVVSDVPFDTGIASSTTYVLENYPYANFRTFLFDYAFQLRVDPVIGGSPTIVNVDGYVPNQTNYPAAYQALPLDGYAAAQWTNADLGEGLLVQVAEQYDTNGNLVRQLVFDLLTLDTNGNPFWLIGNAPFPIGANSIDVDVAYLGPQNAQVAWGKATVTLPDCNHLSVTFTPNGGLAAPVPSFSGNAVYDRLFSENGMMCE